MPRLAPPGAELKSPPYRLFAGSPEPSAWNSKELIRSELFSAERLEQHAGSLAAEQVVKAGPVAGRPLIARLRDNSRVLLSAYRDIAGAIREDRAISPAAEWLVDNYHVVEEQIQQIRDDLPPGYYRQLPKLASGPLAGYPRIFGVAWAFVAHTDSRFEPQLLCRFVRAYQRVAVLTIGELWALAITLRIVLVENLRRAAERIADARAQRQDADALADRLLGSGGLPPEPSTTLLNDWPTTPLSTSFAVQLLHRLRDQDPGVAPALDWLAVRLQVQATSIEEIVREEHHRQGASNLTVRNVITSMRSISGADWPELFERISQVDAELRASSDFALMDFPTRDRYRQAIETIARGSTYTELEITRRALLAARHGDSARSRDPGYHLIAGGRRAFETAVAFKPAWREWFSRLSAATGLRGYLVAIAVVTAIILAVPVWVLGAAGIASGWLGLLATLGLIPAVDAATAMVNRMVMRGFGAKILPALELRAGVPRKLRTLVAVPILLTSIETLAEQLARLEVHHLASPDGDLCFALLSDWRDGAAEHLADDAALLDAAATGIDRLNRRYGSAPAGAVK